MQPMKPQERSAALRASPAADAEDLMQEYERLLAERFSRDPDAPAPAPGPGIRALGNVLDPEDRLKELHRLLFDIAPTP